MEKLYLDHGKKILKIKFVFAEQYQKEKETLGKRGWLAVARVDMQRFFVLFCIIIIYLSFSKISLKSGVSRCSRISRLVVDV